MVTPVKSATAPAEGNSRKKWQPVKNAMAKEALAAPTVKAKAKRIMAASFRRTGGSASSAMVPERRSAGSVAAGERSNILSRAAAMADYNHTDRSNHTSLNVELGRDISPFFILILKPKRNRRFEDIGVYIF